MNTISFYGGQQGVNFEIKKIFRQMIELEDDLQARWQSPISPGEFVVIAYGLPNDDNNIFEMNQGEDLRQYNKTYNGTVWQKIYCEQDSDALDELQGIEKRFVSGNYGLGYKLIFSLTGNTPKMRSAYRRIHSYEEASCKVFYGPDDDYPESSDATVDSPVVLWFIPIGQIIEFEINDVLKAKDEPSLVWDTTSNDYDEFDNLKPKYDSNGNAIPDGKDRPILKIGIPPSWVWQLKTTQVLDANQKPMVSHTKDDDKQYLQFWLPQSQVMDDPETTAVGPRQRPRVTLGGTVNKPKLLFELPNAVKFYFGDLLGDSTPTLQTLNSNTYPEIVVVENGDYYINAETGFIYLVTQNNTETGDVVFSYQACLQPPKPLAATKVVNPFEEDDNGDFIIVEPHIEEEYTDPVNKKGQTFTFHIPKQPNLDIDATMVAPDTDPADLKATITPDAVDHAQIHLDVPRGSKAFAGDEVEDADGLDVMGVTIAGALAGDLYFNTKKGSVYKLDGSGVWKWQNNGLKGDVGDAMKVVATYDFVDNATTSDGEEDDIIQNTSYGPTYIEGSYGATHEISPDVLFRVNWQFTDNDTGTTRIVSYWYFKTKEGNWGRAKLTGNISGGLLSNVYVESPDPVTHQIIDSRGYSINYINGLIGNPFNPNTAKRTAFSKDQIYALFKWGTFAEARTGGWYPEPPQDLDTISASQVIDLMSWGDIAAAIDYAPPV